MKKACLFIPLFVLSLPLAAENHKRKLEQPLKDERPAKKRRILSPAEQQAVNKLLFQAVEQNDFDGAEKAYIEGAQIDARGEYAEQPIHRAATRGRIRMMKWLIKRGASAYARDEFGREPIHYAAVSNRPKTLRWLVRNNAHIDARSDSGRQPIHYAAHFGNRDIIEWLIENGVKINVQDNMGNQPIDLAARYGRAKTVKWLTERGSDINALTSKGAHPMDLAIKYKRFQIAEWLLEHGASISPNQIEILLQEVQKKPIKHLFWLLIALQDNNQANAILEQNSQFDQQTLEYALEVAAAKGNSVMFEQLYPRVRAYYTHDGNQEIAAKQAQFKTILEQLLNWAVRARSEEVVNAILVRAYAYEHAPQLNVSAAGTWINSALAQEGLSDQDRILLEHIRDSLMQVPVLRLAAGGSHSLVERFSNAFTSFLEPALQQAGVTIPPEVTAVILSFLFRPQQHKP